MIIDELNAYNDQMTDILQEVIRVYEDGDIGGKLKSANDVSELFSIDESKLFSIIEDVVTRTSQALIKANKIADDIEINERAIILVCDPEKSDKLNGMISTLGSIYEKRLKTLELCREISRCIFALIEDEAFPKSTLAEANDSTANNIEEALGNLMYASVTYDNDVQDAKLRISLYRERLVDLNQPNLFLRFMKDALQKAFDDPDEIKELLHRKINELVDFLK